MKLKKILKEARKHQWNEENKRAFLEAVSNFNDYGSTIYKNETIKESLKTITELIYKAESFTMNESDDWFDGISVKRDMKQLKESSGLFAKTVNEMGLLQQRLESLYEDMGYKLGKYFEIKEKIDNISDKEAAQDFDDLKDKDVDNDGDTDDSDEYLHKKLGVVAKKVESYIPAFSEMKSTGTVSKFKKM